ncbi:MAG: DASH family cryptochrome, partial [Bacteroidota bacterium]
MTAGLVWFRNDLRIKDNVVLKTAMDKLDNVYPVYVFNPNDYKKNELNFSKIGSYRAKFIIEAVEELRQSLRSIGSDLIVRIGDPKEEIAGLAQEVGAKYVFAGKEATTYELMEEERIENNLWTKGVSLELIWHSTLYHVDDIPWPIKHLPETFTDFRKELEAEACVKALVNDPKNLNSTIEFEVGDIPELSDLGLEEKVVDRRAAMKFKGGEKEAFKRLKSYLWTKDLLKEYKKTRNGLLGADYSSKLSPWLALGCISPRSIYYEVKKYEEERVKNDSTYWLIFELLWRDYFRFIAKKHKNNLFKITGIRNRRKEFQNDHDVFMKWVNGETGEPFANANMIELKRTGYMSNRGRQNVASYLVNDLNINWTWG